MQGEIVKTELENEARTWTDRAKALVINSSEDAQRAAEMLAAIKGLRGKIDEVFDPVIKRAHEAHKTAIAAKKSVEAPLIEAERIVKSHLGQWQAMEERRRREEEARLALLAKQQEEELLLAEALAAEEAGHMDIAEEIISTPILAPAIRVAPARVDGVSFRDIWSAEVIDLFALVKHVATHPSMIHLVTPNMTALNAMARAQKAALDIPGVRAVATKAVAGRAS